MKKILIIEDDKSIAELERDYLEIEGFTVEIALTGQDGLKKALFNDEINLVLLDLMLPGVDGYQICKELRAKKDIPILIISAKKEDFDKILGFGMGADDFIVKPFSPSELVARVKAHLARYDRLIGKEEESDSIMIRGLRIDQGSRQVFVNGQEVTMTAKEFDILAFLAANPNHVFSKEQLFEKLWGYDSLGEISTVTVHIRKIREKIEEDPANPQYIETIWGVGYRFKA